MEVAEKTPGIRLLLESLGTLPDPVADPVFIIVSGLPGSGKTYFSRKLAEEIPVTILESDALRKTLFPKPTYSPDESAALFQTIHRLIQKLLKDGMSVILDATNLSERYREYLYNIADRLGIKLILIYLKASPDVISSRLEARKLDDGNKSDADWGVYLKMLPTVERIGRRHFVVDTGRDIISAIKKVIKEARG